ncbi:MAG TPA: DUF6782 family putative metallopeptidase [Patescibacteria group bacterium]|nr:DUF6782 family putative metallopeptidase [Patescibacteria group bacterium]
MKAGRLSRKTHLKRHAALPTEGGARFFDLTNEQDDEDTTLVERTADKHAPKLIDLTADEPPTLRPLAGLHITGDVNITTSLPGRFQTEEDLFDWCASILAESPTAGRLLEEAAANDWIVGTADLHSGGFYLDTVQKHILLDHFSMRPAMLGRSVYFRNAFITTLIRALRDVWHEQRGTSVASHYKPEDVLMLERIRAADCDTVTIQVGWELRGAGFTDIWRHILGSEEGDMALTFTRYLERDPGAQFDGAALACTFRQWYSDQARVDACDHQALENLDAILMAAEMRNPFGTDQLPATEVEALSSLPDGSFYLAGLGRTVLADPVFAGLSDPVNQTHLFHLIYDMEVTMVNNVPFRDARLARKIFPNAENIRTWR